MKVTVTATKTGMIDLGRWERPKESGLVDRMDLLCTPGVMKKSGRWHRVWIRDVTNEY